MKLSTLALLALATGAQGAQRFLGPHRPASHHLRELEREAYATAQISGSESGSKTVTDFFTQTLDHFDRENNATYQQRYHINTDFYTAGGPVFVYIGGEGALTTLAVRGGEICDVGKVHGAVIVGLEHRYYGQSQPFADFSTPNLRFLSSQQALADLANFIGWIKAKEGWDGNVFTWGGSYPGALSAWFRAKFPHITVGSVASSAPVLAKADFFEYDESVATAAQPTCASAIRKATAAVEKILDASPAAAKEMFDCSAVADDVGFLYVLADAVAYAVQYDNPARHPNKADMCADLADGTAEGYATFVKALFSSLGTSCVDFTSIDVTLEDTTVSEFVGQRQWYYQSCTEFGYFQTAPAQSPLRSSRVNLAYHLDLCGRVFGLPQGPDTAFTNAYYGGNHTASSRIYFPNGSIDPWHVLSLQESLSCCPSEVPDLIDGTSHCADLHSPEDDDPVSLTIARKKIAIKVAEWLKEAQI